MKTEEQVITKFKKKAQEALKSDCLNKISYIIKPKNFIFTLLILTFLPGLISCGGEQRPASLVSATPPEKTSTGVVSPTKGADGRTTPSGGVTPPGVPTGASDGSSQPGPENKTKYTGDIKTIFHQRCFACHGTGKPDPSDWQIYATAKAKIGEIERRVWDLRNDLQNPDAMPKHNNSMQMTPEERALVKKWIDDGGLE